MNSIIQLIGFLFSGLGAGIHRITILTPAVARGYLQALERPTYIAFGTVATFVVLSFITYWVSLLGGVTWHPLAAMLVGAVIAVLIHLCGGSRRNALLTIVIGGVVTTLLWTFGGGEGKWLAWFELIRPLWRIFMLTAGLLAVLFGVLLGVLLTPIGTLVNIATTAPVGTTTTEATTLPWYWWLSPMRVLREVRGIGEGLLKILRDAINQYMEAVRFVLVVSGFGFFFFSFMPRPSVTLALAAVLGLTAIWFNRAYKSIWSWLAQAGVLTILGFYVFYLQFGENLTAKEIRTQARGLKTWVLSFDTFDCVVTSLLLVGGVLLFRWLTRTAPPVVAAKTGDSHPKTTAGNDPHDKKSSVGDVLKVAVLGCVALGLLVLIGMGFQGCQQEHEAVVAESKARRELLRQEAARILEARLARSSRPAPQVVQTRMTSSTAPTASGVVWKGLKNPAKQDVVFTNDMWSPRISRPPRMEGRLEPNLRPIEVRVSRASDPPDTGRIWRDGDTLKAEDAFLEYRFPANTNVVSVTIGMGYKAN